MYETVNQPRSASNEPLRPSNSALARAKASAFSTNSSGTSTSLMTVQSFGRLKPVMTHIWLWSGVMVRLSFSSITRRLNSMAAAVSPIHRAFVYLLRDNFRFHGTILLRTRGERDGQSIFTVEVDVNDVQRYAVLSVKIQPPAVQYAPHLVPVLNVGYTL